MLEWVSRWLQKFQTPPPAADAVGAWEQYRAACNAKPDPNRALDDLEFVVFDTETTGLNPRSAKLLAIGAIRIRNWSIEIDDRFECLVYQPEYAGGQDTSVHEILPGRQGKQLSEQEAILKFLDFTGNAILVGHHVEYDRKIIDRALDENWGGRRLRNAVLDTNKLAQRLSNRSAFGLTSSYSLDELSGQLNVPVYARHTAGGDAFLTGVVLLKLLSRLKDRGVRNRRDLLRGTSLFF